MKRKSLISLNKRKGCNLLREGKKHSLYYNQKNNKTSTITRHSEISDFPAKKIMRDLGVPDNENI